MAPKRHRTGTAAAVAGLLLSSGLTSAQMADRQSASPGYQGIDAACPERCVVSGPNPSNWSLYHNMNQFDNCDKARFYGFSLFDEVDDPDTYHRIFACTAYGHDWGAAPGTQSQASAASSAKEVSVNYQVGWSSKTMGTEVDYSSLLSQMRDYLASTATTRNQSSVLYAQFGQHTAGLYVGRSLLSQKTGADALRALELDAQQFKGQRDSLTMQQCGDDYDSDHIFGFTAVNNGTFETVQAALESWTDGECLSFAHSKNLTGKAQFTAPLLSSIKGDNSTGNATDTSSGTNSTPTAAQLARKWVGRTLVPIGECRTENVVGGDSCGALAQRCGISGADFTKYNSKKGFCAALKPGQHVCCSEGDLPDFKPKPNGDGSCATIQVGDGESCSTIAAANSLEVDDLEDFNKKTWGWNGCKNVWKDAIICVSKGSPPMPSPVANAVCGPQVPGTKEPKDKDKLPDLNPCPLNACCDVFGQCGTTTEFCTDTNTGAPGTAKPGTNGCISNCGTKLVRGSAPASYKSIGYYEGFSTTRKCLHQDAFQIDKSKYTHIHFGFGNILPDYSVNIGDKRMQFEFDNFLSLHGPKKILSFGGWDFSTMPATYQIFRQGTAPANRLTLARNIAKFVNDNGLDGVDIDWEYPSAPDIPGIPAGAKEEGTNYLAFLVILKNLLKDKSVSIAAPASYWYLKGFPIDKISKVVDYIVYMTYDLHGQWDAGNKFSQIGCPSGSCLRSHVNLTETINSLVMITKAGVPSNKIVVGVSSYGRSFNMANAGCHTPECQFTGSRSHSDAEKGECTDTAGYISDAEISRIVANSSRVSEHYIDSTSNSNILVYDNNQWVGYMAPEIKSKRISLYKHFNMGGSVNWATDLEEFHDAPMGKTWGGIFAEVDSGGSPYAHMGPHDGNWSSLTCGNNAWRNPDTLDSPKQRWELLDARTAWDDLIRDWKKYRDNNDKEGRYYDFSTFVAHELGTKPGAECGEVDKNHCSTVDCTDDEKKGPAKYLIWNSLVQISTMYSNYHSELIADAALLIDNSLDDLENIFVPEPPKDDGKWLDIMLSLVSLGAPMVGGKFFSTIVKKLPALIEDAEKGKKVTQTLVSGMVSVATAFKGSDAKNWDAKKQDQFSHYMGKAMYGWSEAGKTALSDMFNGEDKSIDKLNSLIADGKFDGKTSAPSKDDLSGHILKTFYSYSIPAAWQAAGYHPFIIDTGKDCHGDDGDYKNDDHDTKDLAHACVQGRRYKLGYPKGPRKCKSNCGLPGGCDCEHDYGFSPLNGEDKLNGKDWGKVTAEEIIKGAVSTWMQNGKSNDAKAADPNDPKVMSRLIEEDHETPGYVRLPVCDENLALKNWEDSDDNQSLKTKNNWPCNSRDSPSYCGASSFEDQGSDASPTISDCKGIVKNIHGGSYKHKGVGVHHEILHNGGCTFGIYGGAHGSVTYNVGDQDVIDAIEGALKRFSRSDGKIGAKGVFSCEGNAGSESVTWGLF